MSSSRPSSSQHRQPHPPEGPRPASAARVAPPPAAAAALPAAHFVSDASLYSSGGDSGGQGGEELPQGEQQRLDRDAQAAGEAGAADALSEAQAASLAAQKREAREHEAYEANQFATGEFDLGQEFAQYAPPAGGAGQSSSRPVTHEGQADRTFLTGLDLSHSQAQLQQQQQQQVAPQDEQEGAPVQPSPAQPPAEQEAGRMSDEELIGHVEAQMMEFERTAQYLEAEKARQHLESLKKRFASKRRSALEHIQSEDVRVFFAMVASHQASFDRTWSTKSSEHALRAGDLIESMKWKHEEQQRELYETLRRKRMPKFSVELLNLRKRQVSLARAKNYVTAEQVKRRADSLEGVEIHRIREMTREENQLRFQTLLKKQEWERRQLGSKLSTEKRAVLEAKAQDFLRLKKRLRNAEAELKKTHVRQQLLAEKKLLPLYQSFSEGASGVQGGGASEQQAPSGAKSARFGGTGTGGSGSGGSAIGSAARGNVLRNSGMQRMLSGSGGGKGGGAAAASATLRSARELAASRASQQGGASGSRPAHHHPSSSYDAQQAHMQAQRQSLGASIVGSSKGRNMHAREEKESTHGGGAY